MVAVALHTTSCNASLELRVEQAAAYAALHVPHLLHRSVRVRIQRQQINPQARGRAYRRRPRRPRVARTAEARPSRYRRYSRYSRATVAVKLYGYGCK